MRTNNRAQNQLRPVSLERNIQPQAAASVLIRLGNTHVLCAVSVEEEVPPFMRNSGRGWITAEYGILPGATNTRYKREVKGISGRSQEIQRLIGRSLRMMVDMQRLGERTLRVDCDVINADGGTRCAAITGGAIALRDALAGLVEKGLLSEIPIVSPVAAVSVGVVDGVALLDLDYQEDSSADADANFVMTRQGGLVEVQCTAEKQPLAAEEFARLADLARQGIDQLFTWWDR